LGELLAYPPDVRLQLRVLHNLVLLSELRARPAVRVGSPVAWKTDRSPAGVPTRAFAARAATRSTLSSPPESNLLRIIPHPSPYGRRSRAWLQIRSGATRNRWFAATLRREEMTEYQKFRRTRHPGAHREYYSPTARAYCGIGVTVLRRVAFQFSHARLTTRNTSVGSKGFISTSYPPRLSTSAQR